MMTYLSSTLTLTLDQARCNGCRRCVEVCPHGVFSMKGKKAVLQDRDACMECGACERNCREAALRVRAGVGCAFSVLTSTVAPRGPA